MTYQTYLNFKCYTWSGKKNHILTIRKFYFFFTDLVSCVSI